MKKDHLEILLEDIRGKFDLVLEGHDTLRQEIRDSREELGEKINLKDALQYAEQDIKDRWKWYRERYRRRLKNEKR